MHKLTKAFFLAGIWTGFCLNICTTASFISTQYAATISMFKCCSTSSSTWVMPSTPFIPFWVTYKSMYICQCQPQRL